jgi:hypothetical protein
MGQILFVRLKTTHHDRRRLVFLVNVDIDGDAVESAEATARQTRGAVRVLYVTRIVAASA